MKQLFLPDLVLENQRTRLTILKTQDTDLLDAVAYDPEIWKLGMSKLDTRQDLDEYVEVAVNEYKDKLSVPLLIFDKLNQQVAGTTRLGSISVTHKRLEIGWTWLHPKFQRTGLNTHCKFLLLQFAFEVLQVNRVELKTDVLNMQSRTAILKIGAKAEGIFRKHQITSTGRVRDSIFFSIINDEWPELKRTVFSNIKRMSSEK
jgi:N-acetyltransferase